jgi:cytochrome c oxidase subunit 2
VEEVNVNDFVVVAILWTVLTVAGEFLAQWWINSFPVLASVEGLVVDEGFAFVLRTVVPIFAFCVALMLNAAISYRARDGDADPGGSRENRAFSWTWVAVSLVVNVVFLFHPGISGLEEIFGSNRSDLLVRVHSKQWSWTFTYPKYKVSVKDLLVLPAGKRVRFEITSEDVLHSFWVPAFRLKMDAVPGRTTLLFITPTRPIATGDDLNVRVQCAELCGAGHGGMRAAVRVMKPEAFEKWIKGKAGS